MNEKEDVKYIYKLVSERIKLFRKYRGITQEELAILSTYSNGFIGNIESKKTEQTFSLAFLYYVSKKLDIPMELFVKADISKELKELGIEKDS